MNKFERELDQRVKDLQNLKRLDERRVKESTKALRRARKDGVLHVISKAENNLRDDEGGLKKTKADLKVAKQALREFRAGR